MDPLGLATTPGDLGDVRIQVEIGSEGPALNETCVAQGGPKVTSYK